MRLALALGLLRAAAAAAPCPGGMTELAAFEEPDGGGCWTACEDIDCKGCHVPAHKRW